MSSSLLTCSDNARLPQVFSKKVLGPIVSRGDTSPLRKLLNELGVSSTSPYPVTLGEMLDAIFERLFFSGNRSEYVYKTSFTNKHFLSRHRLTSSALHLEFPIDSRRADALLVSRSAHAIEFKSDRDSLDRVVSQCLVYRSMFPIVSVVVAPDFADKVRRILPTTVGVFVLSRRGVISEWRAAEYDIDSFSPEVLANNLRRKELQQILQNIGVTTPEKTNAEVDPWLRRQVGSLDPEYLVRAVPGVILKHRSQSRLSKVIHTVPMSVRAYILEKGLTVRQVDRFSICLEQNAHMCGNDVYSLFERQAVRDASSTS